MSGLMSAYRSIVAATDRTGDWLLPTAARVVFAAVLLAYFWASALTKLGDGVFTPSVGAYAQVFPRMFEAVGYDASQLGLWPRLVVLAGTWGEFLLPALVVLGLFTRLAALGMVGFVVMQSLTDIYGHLAGPETVGAWFDRASDALILDQRAFWMLLFVVLIMKGAGPLSADWLLRRGFDRVAA
jgi:putative oxidoreductase